MPFPLVLLLCLLVFPLAVHSQPLGAHEELSLSRAIDRALKNHPDLQTGASQIKASEARIGQAKANYYPQISISADYKRYRPAVSSRSSGSGSTSGISPGRGTFNQYSTSADLSQNIFDFGRTANRVDIQKTLTESARFDEQNVREQIVYNVKAAYFNLLRAERTRDVAREVEAQYQKHLDQARGFFEVGVKPRFDVTKAEVDLSTAHLSLIKAENQVRLSVVTLNNSMGLPDAPPYTVQQALGFVRYDLPLEKAIEKAEQGRADLQSILQKKQAMKRSIDLARKDYLPTLSGSGAYAYSGADFPLDESWNLGVDLSVPLFSGFLTSYKVAEALANYDVTSANEAALRQDILLQVQQAYLVLKEAAESVATAELAIRQAKENLDIAQGRYDAGVGNPIEVADALVGYNNAQTSYTSALFDYKIARASIEKAIGVTY
jgi:outer membrane protein